MSLPFFSLSLVLSFPVGRGGDSCRGDHPSFLSRRARSRSSLHASSETLNRKTGLSISFVKIYSLWISSVRLLFLTRVRVSKSFTLSLAWCVSSVHDFGFWERLPLLSYCTPWELKPYLGPQWKMHGLLNTTDYNLCGDRCKSPLWLVLWILIVFC
jgi:hypothetical protein